MLRRDCPCFAQRWPRHRVSGAEHRRRQRQADPEGARGRLGQAADRSRASRTRPQLREMVKERADPARGLPAGSHQARTAGEARRQVPARRAAAERADPGA
ncbi:MAG: hypothetical protein MZW92_48705 [Comamonadaceae bacterium]|nr:hypothetical protein [Comamonadaceae bacterium]